jgi:spore coat protein CotF
MGYGIRRSLPTERTGVKIRGQMLIEAHQMIHVGEAMRTMVNCMNTFRMYRTQISDSQMASMIDRQLDHMMGMCNNILNHMQSKEITNITPDRIMNWQSYVNQMHQPITMNTGSLDDHDMAWCMTNSLKSCVMTLSATTMACSEDILRKMVMNCCTSCMNMVYDMLTYMYQKGMFHLSNTQTNAMSSTVPVYQPMSEMHYQ